MSIKPNMMYMYRENQSDQKSLLNIIRNASFFIFPAILFKVVEILVMHIIREIHLLLPDIMQNYLSSHLHLLAARLNLTAQLVVWLSFPYLSP